MNEIVHAHLPGVALVHLPTPPPQMPTVAEIYDEMKLPDDTAIGAFATTLIAFPGHAWMRCIAGRPPIKCRSQPR